MEMKVRKTVGTVGVFATLVALPFLFIFYKPHSVDQLLCGISTRFVSNHSEFYHAAPMAMWVPVPAPAPGPAPVPEQINITAGDEAIETPEDLQEVLNSTTVSAEASADDSLEALLARAATPDKTVIVTTLNAAWATKGAILDIFLESFHKGEDIAFLLRHVVIVALDQASLERCREIHRHCFMAQTEGVDFTGRKRYMTKDFLKMMWRRMQLLKTILELGYNFVFTDADILWFRNPFDHFANNTDFQISSDKYRGNPFSFWNKPNCGYQYARSNNRTIAMYQHWCQGGEDNPSIDEQSLLKLMLKHNELAAFNVRIRFLETDRFSGFCEKSKDMSKVVTMHANCCVGMDNKIHDLRRAMNDWESRSSHAPTNSSGVELWHVPAACRNSLETRRRSSAPRGKRD